MNTTKKCIVKLFNLWALNGRSDTMAEGHYFPVTKMLEMINYKNNYKLLDVGCGNGWVIEKVSESKNCELAVGVDISDKMIELANKRKNKNNQQFLCDDFCSMAIKEKFDVIISMEVFYYIYPVFDALKKAFSMLNHNGCMIMGVDFYRENDESLAWPEMVGLDMQLKSIKEWENLFIDAGFNNVTINRIKDTESEEQWKRDCGTLIVRADKS